MSVQLPVLEVDAEPKQFLARERFSNATNAEKFIPGDSKSFAPPQAAPMTLLVEDAGQLLPNAGVVIETSRVRIVQSYNPLRDQC